MLPLGQVRPEGVDVFTYQASVAALGQVSETVASSRKKLARFGIATHGRQVLSCVEVER